MIWGYHYFLETSKSLRQCILFYFGIELVQAIPASEVSGVSWGEVLAGFVFMEKKCLDAACMESMMVLENVSKWFQL